MVFFLVNLRSSLLLEEYFRVILRIVLSRIVGLGDIEGCSRYFCLNLSDNSVMRGRLDARRTLKDFVADLRHAKKNSIVLQMVRYRTLSKCIPSASQVHPEGQKTSRISIFTCDSKVQTTRNKRQTLS